MQLPSRLLPSPTQTYRYRKYVLSKTLKNSWKTPCKTINICRSVSVCSILRCRKAFLVPLATLSRPGRISLLRWSISSLKYCTFLTLKAHHFFWKANGKSSTLNITPLFCEKICLFKMNERQPLSEGDQHYVYDTLERVWSVFAT